MNTTTHGGPRKNAGRKPSGVAPKKTISISLSPAVLEEAKRRAAANGKSFSAFIETLLQKT